MILVPLPDAPRLRDLKIRTARTLQGTLSGMMNRLAASIAGIFLAVFSVTLSSVHDLAWTSPDIMIVLLILAVLATVILNLRSA